MLKKAEKDPDHYYYLVIEELNRGNAPAILVRYFSFLTEKMKMNFLPKKLEKASMEFQIMKLQQKYMKMRNIQ